MKNNTTEITTSTTEIIASPARAKAPRKSRNFSNAIAYRPRDIHELYGIPASTLHDFCTHEDESIRLPSTLTPGRKGRKGCRIIYKQLFTEWLARWSAAPSSTTNSGRASK